MLIPHISTAPLPTMVANQVAAMVDSSNPAAALAGPAVGIGSALILGGLVLWLLLRFDVLARQEWQARRHLGWRGRWAVAKALNTGTRVPDPQHARPAALTAASHLRLVTGWTAICARIGAALFLLVSVATTVSALIGVEVHWPTAAWGMLASLSAIAWVWITSPGRARRIRRCLDLNSETCGTAPVTAP